MSTGSIFPEQNNLEIVIESLRADLAFKDEKLKNYEQQISWLTEQLSTLKRSQFGKKSERWESNEQLIFNEVEKESKKPEAGNDELEAEVEVKGHTKKRGHRQPLPTNLPREIEKIELPAEEQISEDGTPLKIIGWEKSEKLKYEPAKMSIVEIHRAKYGPDSGDYEKTAPPPPAIIPKGIATPELLAAIIVGKYCDGMPLYRQEEFFSRHGIELSRGTMARWVVKAAEAFRPLWNVLSDRLLASFYVACDETTVQVLKENGRRAEDKSWMVVRSTPYGDKKIVLFDYSPSRKQSMIKELFLDYQGIVQCDGLNIYDVLSDCTRIGCAMHARRRFEQAAVDGAKAGKSLGEEGLNFFKRLYDFEEEIKDKPPDEKFQAREKIARPIWEELKTWGELNQRKVPKQSKIGQGFSYLLGEYEYLTGYLKDGRLNIDNGFTERMIRKFAIGRNNWLFSDTVEGAEASSLFYSLVITAKVNEVNPYRAMVQLCTEVPKAKTLEDYERLVEIVLSPKPIL